MESLLTMTKRSKYKMRFDFWGLESRGKLSLPTYTFSFMLLQRLQYFWFQSSFLSIFEKSVGSKTEVGGLYSLDRL